MNFIPFVWLIGWAIFLLWFENNLKKHNKYIMKNGLIFLIASYFFYPAWFVYYKFKGF